MYGDQFGEFIYGYWGLPLPSIPLPSGGDSLTGSRVKSSWKLETSVSNFTTGLKGGLTCGINIKFLEIPQVSITLHLKIFIYAVQWLNVQFYKSLLNPGSFFLQTCLYSADLTQKSAREIALIPRQF